MARGGGGFFSPDSHINLAASLWFSSTAPAWGPLQPHRVPSVPSGNPGWSSLSGGDLPIGEPLIRVDIAGRATRETLHRATNPEIQRVSKHRRIYTRSTSTHSSLASCFLIWDSFVYANHWLKSMKGSYIGYFLKKNNLCFCKSSLSWCVNSFGPIFYPLTEKFILRTLY